MPPGTSTIMTSVTVGGSETAVFDSPSGTLESAVEALMRQECVRLDFLTRQHTFTEPIVIDYNTCAKYASFYHHISTHHFSSLLHKTKPNLVKNAVR